MKAIVAATATCVADFGPFLRLEGVWAASGAHSNRKGETERAPECDAQQGRHETNGVF